MISKTIKYLIILNLFFLALILFSKVGVFSKFISTIGRAFILPILISVFLFYIIKPLNDVFIKKGIKYGYSAMLTLAICFFITAGISTYFGNTIISQFNGTKKQLYETIQKNISTNSLFAIINSYINMDNIYSLLKSTMKNPIHNIGEGVSLIIHYVLNTLSSTLLVVVLLFYLLKDGHDFKDNVLFFIPTKYKSIASKTLSESNAVLSHYVTGQSKVALSLSVMVFIAFTVIGMPNSLFLSSITLVLAFIPFLGFFISMLLPTIIALSIGLYMLSKLAIVLIIVETIKGRVVVPAIMSHAMKIHPLTDIFLVIGAISLSGPLAAIVVVPIYTILKTLVCNIYETKRS